MAAFLDLVKLVTGIGDEESTTGHDASATKWVFVDEKDTVKISEGDKQEQKAHEVVDTEVGTDPLALNSPDSTSLASSQQHTETHNGKKSKSKKKKRKSRNRSNSIASSSKSVSWGEVEEILFTREQGIGAVPSSGLYPLGLGTEVLDARDIVSVDHHVSMGQVRLIERALKLGICVDQNDNEYECLETRQFDYRHGKNPLFHASNEDERISLLGDIARPRSRSRSSSIGSSEDTIHTINDSNKDIIDIRNSRKVSAGCSCKAVKVDKLSVTKLRQELLNNQDKIALNASEIQALGKAELANQVRDMLHSCPMCVSNNCMCYQAGIGCHPEVCGCSKHKNHQACANTLDRKSVV